MKSILKHACSDHCLRRPAKTADMRATVGIVAVLCLGLVVAIDYDKKPRHVHIAYGGEFVFILFIIRFNNRVSRRRGIVDSALACNDK